MCTSRGYAPAVVVDHEYALESFTYLQPINFDTVIIHFRVKIWCFSNRGLHMEGIRSEISEPNECKKRFNEIIDAT